MKTNKKQIAWAIILALFIVIFLATGCKPKQIIHERVVTKVDSTAVYSLQKDITAKNIVIENLQRDLQHTREENSKLMSEVSSKTTKYDTSKPIVPETGKPPVAEETVTESKTSLEKKLTETETENIELRRENTLLTTEKTNLGYKVDQLREENRELKSKTTPQAGFNFRLALWSLIIGAVLGILGYLFLWPKVFGWIGLLRKR